MGRDIADVGRCPSPIGRACANGVRSLLMQPFQGIRSLCLFLALTCTAAWGVPLPEGVREAVEQVKASDGFRPRAPFFLLEQETPRLAGDAEARRALAALLAQAVAAPDIAPNAKTVLSQFLYQVAEEAVPAVALKPPEAAAAYLARLGDAQPSQRIAALSALAHFYPAEAKTACVKALKDADAKVRATAVRSLAVLDASALAGEVQGMDAEAQAVALEALTEARAKGALGLAVALAKSGDEQVRAAALRLLGAVGGAEDVPFLAECGAVEALAQLSGEGVDEAIFDAIEERGVTATRVALINAAVLRNAEGLTECLASLHHDVDGKVRVAALKALGRVGDVAAYTELCNAVECILDGDTWEEAVKQMGRRMTDRKERMTPILNLLNANDDDLPDVIRAALLRLLVPLGGDDEALAAVRARVDSPVETIRDAAVRALTEWPDAAAFPDLQKIAADEGASKTHRTLAERAVERMRVSWSRYAALAYLNCGGAEKEAAGKSGVKLRVANGDAWVFQEGAEGTVFYSGTEVQAEATGLKDGKNALLGFTWWDYDGNGRVQSVWVNGRMVLAPTALPDFKAKREGAAVVTVVVPGELIKGGKADIRFKREAASNALVSEVWVGEAPEGAEAKLPEPPPLAAVKANPGAPKKILILTGLEHHNNWKQNTPRLTAAFAEDKRLEVSVSEDPMVMTMPEVLAKYDGFVLYYNNSDKKPSPAGALETLAKAVGEGRGLVLVHFASGAFYDWGTEKVDPAFTKIAGRVWNPKLRGHDPHGTFTVNIADKEHPVTKGLADFETVDELYTCLEGDVPIHVVATAVSKVDQKVYPIAFVLNPGKGRTFHCALGHDEKAFTAKPLELFRRGTLWSVGLE